MKIDPSDYVVIKKSDLEEKFAEEWSKDETARWVKEYRLNMWTIPEFQKDMVENTFRWFPETVKDGQIDLHMLLYGIAGEAGEIMDEMKKFLRGSRTQEELVEKLGNESVDCFHYIVLLWYVLGIDPGEVHAKLTEANEKRFGQEV